MMLLNVVRLPLMFISGIFIAIPTPPLAVVIRDIPGTRPRSPTKPPIDKPPLMTYCH